MIQGKVVPDRDLHKQEDKREYRVSKDDHYILSHVAATVTKCEMKEYLNKVLVQVYHKEQQVKHVRIREGIVSLENLVLEVLVHPHHVHHYCYQY